MASPPKLRSIHLDAFKSYRDQSFAVESLTLIIGPNGSGKSNALDALAMLALLADGRDIADLERGDQEVAGPRGGLSGAVPYGGDEVKLGCEIITSDGDIADYALSIRVGAVPEITAESLKVIKRGRETVLLDAKLARPESGIIPVGVYSGGAPRTYDFLSSRLAIAQAITKVPGDTKARRTVVRICTELVDVLTKMIVLDPVPAEMRGYVRIGTPPDRSARSLSATVWSLQQDDAAWQRLNETMKDLVDANISSISFYEGGPAQNRQVDVMVALKEQIGDAIFEVPAVNMSDGTLRYLAIVASLLSFTQEPQSDSSALRTMIVEEIENGLFPSQGAKTLELLRREANSDLVNLIATTHSPALLDAVETADHEGVIICERDEGGWSVLRGLKEHPRYVDLAGSGALGRELMEGALTKGKGTDEMNWGELFD